MRKLIVLLMASALWFVGVAQPAKKHRNTASNTKEAVSERAITKRFNQGLRYYYTAQYEDALQSFSGILIDAPKHAPSYFMLFRVYVGRQQFTEAENALKQAVKLDKNNVWYQVELARMYMTDKNYKSATPMWEKICRDFPENSEYLTFLATCYTKIGASDKAAEIQSRLDKLPSQVTVEEHMEVIPDNSRDGDSYKSQGLAALKSQQYEQAVVCFEKALREDDTDYDLWSAFADAVAKSGQWGKLTALEDDLTTLFPQSAALLSALADAFLHDSHPDKAVGYYKQALSFAFDADQIQLIRKGLYDAYTQMGDSENAARYR